MRDGRLLAQSSPDNLLRAYNTTVSVYVVHLLQYIVLCVCIYMYVCMYVCVV